MPLYIIVHVPQLLYACSFSLLHHIYPQDKLTVVKLSVIIILISVAVLNITLVGAVAMTWKYCEHIELASYIFRMLAMFTVLFHPLSTGYPIFREETTNQISICTGSTARSKHFHEYQHHLHGP